MAVADSITSALLRFGRPMVLRRLTWIDDVATATDVTVYGVAEGLLSHALTDGMSSSESSVVTFSAAQIVAAGWPGPPRQNDQLVIDDGQERAIIGVETKYLGTEILVYVCKVRALSFDRSVRLERAVVTTNSVNEEVKAWAEFATVSASKVDISADEKFGAAEVAGTVVTRFRVKWSLQIADLSPIDRVVYEDRVYEIRSVTEIMFKAELEIFATARADGGTN